VAQLYTRINRGKLAKTDAAGRFRIEVPFTGMELTLIVRHRRRLPVSGIMVKPGETKALEDIVVKED
jgi:hypothetical protein